VVEADEGRLDIGRCVQSGQMFRWSRLDEGTWAGVDGGHWYLIEEQVRATRFRVRSNVGPAEFERLFRLDWDAAEVERELLVRGPELGPYLRDLRGLRVMRPADPVEVLFSFLCTSNNHIARITKMVDHLAAFGSPIGWIAGVRMHRFPEVESIAWLHEDSLRAAGFGYRGRSVPLAARQLVRAGKGLVQEVRSGRKVLEAWRSLSDRDLRTQLMELEGVGPKLADCIALFGFDRTEVAPIDTHVWQALVRLYFPDWKGKTVTAGRYREGSDFLRDRFGRYTAWAQQVLFYESVLNWRKR
jgi:N-glycosylase/DNA lyase